MKNNTIEPRIRITGGGLRRPKPATPPPRMTVALREEHIKQLALAREQAVAGNEAALRSLTDVRYAAECVTDLGKPYGQHLPSEQYGRRRKFSNPLFLTPAGHLKSYPEEDEHLFVSSESAVDAVKKLGQGSDWEVRETLLCMELARKPYLRWVIEVKGRLYSEPRRSLDDLAEIYRQGGRAALCNLYTKSYVCKILVRLRASGVAVDEVG
jgi:hypothetical protein